MWAILSASPGVITALEDRAPSDSIAVAEFRVEVLMRTLLTLLILLILLGTCSAGATFSTRIDIWNHGGRNLQEQVGANKGDWITLEVRCNRTLKGTCFPIEPYLSDFRPMVRTFWKRGHQKYAIESNFTGEQVINAAYLGLGPEVHYEIHILASEPL
jgi:hypothetical protein